MHLASFGGRGSLFHPLSVQRAANSSPSATRCRALDRTVHTSSPILSASRNDLVKRGRKKSSARSVEASRSFKFFLILGGGKQGRTFGSFGVKFVSTLS